MPDLTAIERDEAAAPETVALACPLCGGEGSAELIHKLIFADPREPCLRCCDCGALWRVNLYEVEEDTDA